MIEDSLEYQLHHPKRQDMLSQIGGAPRCTNGDKSYI